MSLAKGSPTMRAADGGESARFTGICLALSFFCSQAFIYSRPLSAANAHRWAAEVESNDPKKTDVQGDKRMSFQTASNSTPDSLVASRRKSRLLLFLITYIAGAILATGLIINPAKDYSSFVFSILITFAFLLSFLPFGFVFSLDNIWSLLGLNTATTGAESGVISSSMLLVILAGISYMLFFIVPIISSVTAKARIFRILYLSYLGLMIINIVGWLTVY